MIVITGAAGFIGSYFVKKLIGQHTSARDLCLVDEPSAFETRECTATFRDRPYRQESQQGLLDSLASGELKPRKIYHFGASSSTDETREDYLKQVNTDYSQALWNFATEQRVPFVYASSASTYGAGELGFSDDLELLPKLRPLNLYGWSKQKFDLFVVEQMKLSKTPPTWAGLKFFNVYGPGESHKGKQTSVVYQARKQILENGYLKLFKSHKEGVADGEQKRDFVHVEDCVKVALAFAGGKLKSGIYNVGTGTARSFLDLGKATAAALGKDFKVEFVDTPPHLREHYQYWTQAELTNLRLAGYARDFLSLEDGIKAYMDRFHDDPG